MITSNIAFYPCLDLEQTKNFYSDIVGLKLVFENHASAIFSCGKGHFGFVDYGDGSAATGRLCLSLNCDSEHTVYEHYKRVSALGAVTLGEPSDHPTHPVYSFFMPDPNGYLVEFQKLKNLCI